eukprot:9331624-Alexandrium_andersonii.AAC.1
MNRVLEPFGDVCFYCNATRLHAHHDMTPEDIVQAALGSLVSAGTRKRTGHVLHQATPSHGTHACVRAKSL